MSRRSPALSTPLGRTGSDSTEALARAAERLGLRLVVRFGSRADGAVPPPTRESDLDLAVLADPARRVAQGYRILDWHRPQQAGIAGQLSSPVRSPA